MKKFITILCCITILCGCGITKRDFTAITCSQNHEISKIECSDSGVDTDAYLKMMESSTFEPFEDDIGNTSHTTFTFYDKSGAELFKLIDIGNKNLIKIVFDEEHGGESVLYKYTEK